jgi:hypothetical protein
MQKKKGDEETKGDMAASPKQKGGAKEGKADRKKSKKTESAVAIDNGGGLLEDAKDLAAAGDVAAAKNNK